MKLAWQNIIHDRLRFLVTVVGVSFAVFLMVFQGSLLAGFLRAASKLIDASDFDLWITARGVPAFEFGAAVDGRAKDIAAGVPGVTQSAQVCMAFAVYRKQNGKQQVIGLVGADPNIGIRFPVPGIPGDSTVPSPDAVYYDRSDRDIIEAASLPADVEINRRRAVIERQVDGFGSFLGLPFLFTSYRSAAHFIGLGPEQSMYILLRVANGYSVPDVQAKLRKRLPEVDVLTREEFSRKSRLYWITKTGAGGAILAGAILGFLIGLVVVSQTIYANTMENIEEYATLKALGATGGFVARIVIAQALLCGVLGSVLGLTAVMPVVERAKSLIPWIYTPSWLPLAMALPSLLMCALASVVSVRTAITVEPARVFRA